MRRFTAGNRNRLWITAPTEEVARMELARLRAHVDAIIRLYHPGVRFDLEAPLREDETYEDNA